MRNIVKTTPFNTLKTRATKIKRLLSSYAERHPDVNVEIRYGDVENGKTLQDIKPIVGRVERYETPRKPIYVLNTREGKRFTIDTKMIILIRDLKSGAYIYTHPKHVFFKGELY